MKNIWVLCGGPSTEFEVSLSSGRVVCERIRLEEYLVRPVVITRSRRWIIAERVLEKDSDRAWLATFFKMAADPSSTKVGCDVAEAAARMIGEGVHCAFLALHGQFGEDGAVQGFLETLGIPYTGSDVLASAIAFHKILSLDIFRGAGLTTPRGMRVHRETPISKILEQLQLPVFVKPVCGGSSVGMSYVEKEEDLAPAIKLALATDTEALVEEKVVGVEVSCGVLDLVRDGSLVSTPLPPTEIRPLESAYFDYEAKYRPGKSKEITPANLPPTIIRKIQSCALRAHQALGCEGMSRTDMIVREDGEPVVLETNTIPGMTPTSLLPQQAEAIGISFADFLDALIVHALQRELLRCKQTGGH